MDLKRFRKLELCRCLGRWKAWIFIIIYIIFALVLQFSIGEYQENQDEKHSFTQYENERFDYFQLYAQYGWLGFRMIYLPGPVSALCSNGGIIPANLNVTIDTSEKLVIYESFTGINSFSGFNTLFGNLTGWMLLLGALIAVLCGVDAFKDREFLKFWTSIMPSRRKIIFGVILYIRLLFLLGIHLIFTLTAWILYLVNGYSINVGWLSIYFLVAFMMATFFLLVGMIAGILKVKATSIMVVFGVWLLFSLVLPAMVGKIVLQRTKALVSTYTLELKKYRILCKIEEIAKKEKERLDSRNLNSNIMQKVYELLLKSEFQNIYRLEQAMINEMKEVIALHHTLSSLFPTTFFLSANNEISSRGYQNLMAFYEHVFKHKQGFIHFYAEKVFYTNEKTVIPYLMGDELVMIGSSMLPGYFVFGILVSLFWILGLINFSWIHFNRLLAQPAETDQTFPKDQYPEINHEDVRINETALVFTKNPAHLAKLRAKLERLNISFTYVPRPNCLPGDMTIGNLLGLFDLPVSEKWRSESDRYIHTLSLDAKARVLLTITQTLDTEVFLFDNLLTELEDETVNDFLATLATLKNNRKIFYFSTSFMALKNSEARLLILTGESNVL